MTTVTPGKLAGLKAVSNSDGIIAAAAMDQRGSLQKSISAARGSDATGDDLVIFKELVTKTLTRYASAILLDPEYGLPASRMRNDAGLLLAYEKTGYDAATPGRLPDLLDVWSVRRLKEAGADCVKILLYYTPYEAAHVNDLKHAWIERIGDECRYHDIPFFMEPVGYDENGKGEKTLEYARKKPSVVAKTMEEFGNERYGIDILKVEVPVEMTFVSGTKAFKGEQAYTREQAAQLFRDAENATDKPFIYLSAGVTNPIFIETLALAGESGTQFSGVLCGRATWFDGIKIYGQQGAKAFEDWLETVGVDNIQHVNEALKAATPWYKKMGAASLAELG
jgi:tagatose 1,6-diphosphate aldolase